MLDTPFYKVIGWGLDSLKTQLGSLRLSWNDDIKTNLTIPDIRVRIYTSDTWQGLVAGPCERCTEVQLLYGVVSLSPSQAFYWGDFGRISCVKHLSLWRRCFVVNCVNWLLLAKLDWRDRPSVRSSVTEAIYIFTCKTQRSVHHYNDSIWFRVSCPRLGSKVHMYWSRVSWQ